MARHFVELFSVLNMAVDFEVCLYLADKLTATVCGGERNSSFSVWLTLPVELSQVKSTLF